MNRDIDRAGETPRVAAGPGGKPSVLGRFWRGIFTSPRLRCRHYAFHISEISE
jgi:hypothetical protein